MSIGLLVGCDVAVAQWLFDLAKSPAFGYDKALGLVDDEGNLSGAFLLHGWNGYNVELSYYGRGALRSGIVRCLAVYILHTFDPSRLTVTVSKRSKKLFRSLQKFGFRLEGTQRRYYGKRDCARNVGIRLVMFREIIEQLARVGAENNEAA